MPHQYKTVEGNWPKQWSRKTLISHSCQAYQNHNHWQKKKIIIIIIINQQKRLETTGKDLQLKTQGRNHNEIDRKGRLLI